MSFAIIREKYTHTLNKLIRNNLLADIFILFIIFPAALFAQAPEGARDLTISKTLDIIEAHKDLARPEHQEIGPAMPSIGLSNIERGYVIEKTLGDIEFALAIGLGYLAGDTSYEIEGIDSGIAWKSELIFPFNNWVWGGNILAGRYPFYLNFQGWTNIGRRTNSGMTDKDWIEGELWSSTESEDEAQIRILDFNLLYNFWQGDKPWGDVSKGFDRGRFGLLVGYRYEKFKHDIIGYTDLMSCGHPSYYSGVRVLDYEVKYHIPYFGLNFQYFKDVIDKELDNWGVNFLACASPYVTAKDLDYHLLRNKLARGSTSGYALLMGLSTFLKTKSNWLWKFGFDYTGINTKGKQYQFWYGDDPSFPGDETGLSYEGIGLKIKSAQYLFWGQLQYNF